MPVRIEPLGLSMSDLEGRWVVESLSIGGELHDPIEGPDLTLEVNEDGRVGGSAGINRFMGRLDPDGLFGPLATTLMAGPEELMAQEQVYLHLLEAASSVEPIEEGMSLVGGGLILVTLKPAVQAPVSEAAGNTT